MAERMKKRSEEKDQEVGKKLNNMEKASKKKNLQPFKVPGEEEIWAARRAILDAAVKRLHEAKTRGIGSLEMVERMKKRSEEKDREVDKKWTIWKRPKE